MTMDSTEWTDPIFGKTYSYDWGYDRFPKFAIKNVKFNPPATIVFWEDGTKTVVKAGENDIFDPEKGLAMAITKKALGNEGNYYNVIRKWVEAYQIETMMSSFEDSMKNAIKTMENFRIPELVVKWPDVTDKNVEIPNRDGDPTCQE